MQFANALESIRKELSIRYRGPAPDTITLSRRHLVLLLEDWERLDTTVRTIANREDDHRAVR